MKNNRFYEKIKERARGLLFLALVIMAAWYVSEFHYQLMMIQGDSMSPSFHHLQMVVLNKHQEEFSYGDVIAFQCDGLDAVLVKRVAACPGDEVIIKDDTLYVNNQVSEVFSQENIFEYTGLAEKKICLDEEQYFVIGDNIKESKDSRYKEVGCIDKKDIIGRVYE